MPTLSHTILHILNCKLFLNDRMFAEILFFENCLLEFHLWLLFSLSESVLRKVYSVYKEVKTSKNRVSRVKCGSVGSSEKVGEAILGMAGNILMD